MQIKIKKLWGILLVLCSGMIILLGVLLCVEGTGLSAAAASEDLEVLLQYQEFEARFNAIETVKSIEEQRFDVIEEQTFRVVLESFGDTEVTFIPAMDIIYQRLLIFIADDDGQILYKCHQLATNQLYLGKMRQPTCNIAAVSFQDADNDGLTDIILITRCVNLIGDYIGKPYKIGDVLFQKDGGFYRDYRISDKINRFSMNKSANCIASFVRDGHSTEFLYTASTERELLQNGFKIIEEQCYTRSFEKLGKLKVMPGVYRISEYDVFMVYLINEQGDIVWSFQPMGDYDNLYSLKGMTGKDMDGDGMKDLVVLARYSYEGADGEIIVDAKCSIYYQRTGGFDIDTGFNEYYQCTEEDTMEELVSKIRSYWGWQPALTIVPSVE